MFLLLTGLLGQHELWKSDLHKKTKGGTDSDLVELSEIGQDKTKRAVCGTARPCSQGLNYLEGKVSLCNKEEHCRR